LNQQLSRTRTRCVNTLAICCDNDFSVAAESWRSSQPGGQGWVLRRCNPLLRHLALAPRRLLGQVESSYVRLVTADHLRRRVSIGLSLAARKASRSGLVPSLGLGGDAIAILLMRLRLPLRWLRWTFRKKLRREFFMIVLPEFTEILVRLVNVFPCEKLSSLSHRIGRRILLQLFEASPFLTRKPQENASTAFLFW